jgi:hypothetical protein
MSAAHMVLFQYFQDKTEENHKKSSQNGPTLGKNATGIVQNSSRMLTPKPRSFVGLQFVGSWHVIRLSKVSFRFSNLKLKTRTCFVGTINKDNRHKLV